MVELRLMVVIGGGIGDGEKMVVGLLKEVKEELEFEKVG